MKARLCTLTLAAIVLAALTIPADAKPLPFTHVRCLEPRSLQLFQDAVAQSSTVRRLASRIERSDLVVFVHLGMLQGEMIGKTNMISSAPGARYVLVTLDPLRSPTDRVGALAHELQHVSEIADAPDVKDERGMRELFKRIGWRNSRDDRWETSEAIETGRQAAREAAERPAHITDLVQNR